ncbi:mechanosensitive ion channel family protein [Desulfuribacillus alkaliarsenatis]|uniref:Mechanosensitive ion channel protein n=1 Tax=Desulfuribacillus alkaliarsenatis TaxID=766136 RepID=A0A1E5G207_9FIRM|nr:mechanosensitive ion channel family protein [Desulfuribacillus alkaliarsenatis]OEF97019.1 hypothetical protein BHF68_05310 [Desulfuribacillus alkaliarsenatis]
MDLTVFNHYFEGIILNWQEVLAHRYFYATIVVIAFFVFRKLVVNRVFRFVAKRLEVKTTADKECIRTQLFQKIFAAVSYSLRNIFFIVGLITAVYIAQFSPRVEFVFIHFLRSLIIFFVGLGFYRLLDALKVDIDKLFKFFNEKFDKILIDFTLKVSKGLVIVTTVLLIMDVWGFEVSTFIAGLGLGGLAFALAAKDLVANIFAGFVVITDKPYSIGDWIESPDVEGTVEEITFRSTKVRTFANAIVTVPNAKLVDGAITNWTRMRKRRISFKLGVTYSTSVTQLRTVVKRIEEMLRSHPEVDQDVIFVKFNEFADSSLNIFMYYFTRTTVWGEFLAVREDTLMKVMEILKEEGVSVAFPSRSLYIENSDCDKVKETNSIKDENIKTEQDKEV